MKLCFECSEYPPGLHGGIGSLVQILARGLVKAGHQVRVVGLYHTSNPAPDFEDDAGVQVWRFRFPSHRFGWLSGRRRMFSLLQSWCRSGEIDLIEVPDWGSPAAGWPSLPVPVIVRLSGSASYFSTEMGSRPPIREFIMERLSIRRADFTCSNSDYIGTKTRSLFRLRSSPDAVIYTPVHVHELIADVQRDANTVVFAGTLAEKKGVISLVKCWPDVKRLCPNAKLQIWGKDGKAPAGGSMQRYLTSLVPADIAQSVSFHGHVPLEELLTVFQKAAVTALPSYAEGFALTPLHAMAAGCPTIYTTRGSGPELIVDGETGLLVDPDQPGEIAKAIVTLLRNRELADRVGANGRIVVQQRFSWPVLQIENEQFYRQCLEKFRRNQQSRKVASVLAEGLASASLWMQTTRLRHI